jgi:hypothetical protein
MSADSGGDVGVYLAGEAESGTAFLIRNDGTLDYGTLRETGAMPFSSIGVVDREISVGDSVTFRLIRQRKMTEFYIDDYLMVSYELPSMGDGGVGLIGTRDDFTDLAAWHCRS